MILRFELASLYYAAAATVGAGVGAGAADLRTLADAARLTPLDLTFRDYVCSMESMKASPTYIKSMNYWLERLESLSTSAELPLLSNVASSSSAATSASAVGAVESAAPVERIFHHHGGRLPQAQWEKIKASCARFNVSATCLLLTIYGMSLARYSATKSFVVNVLYTMRHPVHADVHRVVGNFTSSILVEFSAYSNKVRVHVFCVLRSSFVCSSILFFAHLFKSYSSGGGGLGGADAAKDWKGKTGTAGRAEEEPFVNAVLRTFERLWSDLDHAYVDGIEVMQDLNRRSGRTFQAVAPFAFVSTIGLSSVSDKGSDGSSRKAYEKSGVTQVYSCVQTPQTWVDHQVEEDRGCLLYNIDIVDGLFPPAVVRGIVATYEALLGALAGSDEAWERPITALLAEPALVPSVEPACALSDDLLQDRAVRRAMSAQRDAEAVIDAASGLRLTYAALEAASRRAALRVVERLERAPSARAGVPVWDRPEWRSRVAAQSPNVVAIVADKSWVQVVGALAALRAGCVYLPLDPKLPQKRIEQVLELSHALVVIAAADAGTKYAWLSGDALFGRSVVRVTADDAAACDVEAALTGDAALRERVAALGRRAVAPRDLAYLIYTSGSTGVPKGVACHHEGAMNTVDDLNARFSVGASDRCIALSSLSFDLSVYDIFGMLAAGAAIVIPVAESVSPPDPGAWLELVERESVTVWNTVPAFVQLLVNFADHVGQRLPGSLRTIFMSGDWIPLSLPPRIRALAAEASASALRVISMGGATEAAVWSNTFEISASGAPPAGWSSIPYGVPMRNQTMHVLEDATMQRCELWVTGVIYIGGAGVALGYWGDAVKTKQQFVVHPTTGEYLFRTGDLGRYRPSVGDPNGDVLIEILGREDTQVKVNGFRIELGEIERVLQQLPGVKAAITVVHNKSALATYVLLEDGAALAALDADALAERVVAHCAAEMPTYMVPRYVTSVDAIPLSGNGKVDRTQLPPPRLVAPSGGRSGWGEDGGGDGRAAPAGELETLLQGLFADALGVEPLGLVVSSRCVVHFFCLLLFFLVAHLFFCLLYFFDPSRQLLRARGRLPQRAAPRDVRSKSDWNACRDSTAL